MFSRMLDTGYENGARRGAARFLGAAGALGLILHGAAQTPSQPGEQVFVQQVQPLLAQKCLACHSAEARQSDLDLSTREGILRGGTRGPAIVPGNPKESLLYKLITHQAAPGMPPGGEKAKLTAKALAGVANWIQAGAPFAASKSDFDQQIRPILEAKCLSCHGANGVKRAGLDLSTEQALLQGGDDGKVVAPGKSAESLLVKRIRHEVQPGMPFQGDKLSQDEIDRIAAWIDGGASYAGRTLSLSGGKGSASPVHWAFQRPAQPPVPKVKSAAWVRNPIDAFIAAERDKKGLAPVGEAERRVLLRRLSIDLIGLPPTPEEMKTFLADRSADAYEKAVDRLLADPRYGERWGRHWMDVWRYSDPDGYAGRVDYSQKHIWQWRDWIIESMNQDKGYDRMVMEMLAGDELAPTDPQTLRATGYLARSWYRFNRHSWLQDTVDHTATAFLGVTLRCARCHEHKYDPFEQEEYYRFRAFFEPYDVRTDRVPGEPNIKKNGLPRVFEAEPREALADEDNPGVLLPAIFGKTHRFVRGEETNPDSKVLTPAVPKALGGSLPKIQTVALPVEASYPALRPFVQQDLLKEASGEIVKAEGNLERAKRALAYSKQRALKVSAGEVSASAARAESGSSEQAPKPEEIVSFDKDIKPVFQKRCFACHNAQTNRSGLSLETVEAILAGGNKNGPAVIPRNADDSPLIMYLRGERNPRMPVTGDPLAPEQIAAIGKWIQQLPEEDAASALRKAEAGLAAAEKDLAAARASLPALEARIAADKAKFLSAPVTEAEVLGESARKLERQAHLLKAEADLLRAQHKLSEALSGPAPADDKADKDREKKVAAARKELDSAQKALSLSTGQYTHIGVVYPKQSSGRRTALAAWIVSPENPLAARVAVNHMWLRHFGRALVPTVENFGLSGARPSNQQLLDWLALKLIQDQWSMKAMHRLMVTSATYRMDSFASAQSPSRAIDPDNHYFWRANPRRMEAEAVRDSVLYAAGQLETALGGPDEEDVNSHRRGMYFKQTPYSQTQFLQLFDVANPAECYQRSESIVPQQALALANSSLSLAAARSLARKLASQTGDGVAPAAFVANAFEAVLGRSPSAEESGIASDFLVKQANLLQEPARLTAFGIAAPDGSKPSNDPAMRARENLVHVLFNHNDFVTVR